MRTLPLIILAMWISSFLDVSAQNAENIIAMEQFQKISVPEPFTKTVVTQKKITNWVFTKTAVYSTLNKDSLGTITPFEVINYGFKKDLNGFIFVCKDPKSGKQLNVFYQVGVEKRVLLQAEDKSFETIHCHN